MTPRFLADENIDSDLVLGLRRHVKDIDIVRVQDVGLRTVDDSTILQWAADNGRVLVTHDVKTMPGFAGERLAAGQSMNGVILIRASVPLAQVIDLIATVAGATEADEWVGQIAFLPF